jgi:hypothetical protein
MAWSDGMENNRVRRIAIPAAGLARKQQLRKTGYRDGLRSDSTVKDVRARVQRKEFILLIEYTLST